MSGGWRLLTAAPQSWLAQKLAGMQEQLSALRSGLRFVLQVYTTLMRAGSHSKGRTWELPAKPSLLYPEPQSSTTASRRKALFSSAIPADDLPMFGHNSVGRPVTYLIWLLLGLGSPSLWSAGDVYHGGTLCVYAVE